MRFEGYSLRMAVVATSAMDGKSWYGINPIGFGDNAGLSSREYQPPFGFASRPVDFADGVGCNCLVSNAGGFAWLGHDPRYNDKCPPLTQGSSAQWTSDGAFVLLDAVKHSTLWYVPRGNSAHAITVGADANDADLIELRHAGGSLLYCKTDTGWMISVPGGGYIQINGTEVTVNGALTINTSLSVGGAGGQSVVNATGFALAITAASAAFAGGGAPATQAQVMAALTALAAALQMPACATQMLKAV